MIRWLLGILAGAALLVAVEAAANEHGWWRFALALLIAGAGYLYLRHELAHEQPR